MKIFEALALRILSLSHLFKGLNMLKIVHASWHKKSWVENNSRKDTVEIRETERIEHGETKEEKHVCSLFESNNDFSGSAFKVAAGAPLVGLTRYALK